MLFLRTLYLIVISIAIIAVLGCFIEAIISKNKFYKDIANLEFICVVCLLSYMLALLVQNSIASTIFYSIYSSCLDMTVYAIILFLHRLEGVDINAYPIKQNRRFFEILSSLDILVLYSNFITHFYFDVTELYAGDTFLGFIPVYSSHYMIHLVLCYLLGIHVTWKFVKDIKNASKFYKAKFAAVLIIFLCTLLSNLLVKLFWKYNYLDFSLIVYGLLMVAGFSLTNYLLPKGLMRNMLSIVSENISDGIICFDYLGKCIYANKEARKVYNSENLDASWLKPYYESKDLYIEKQEKITFDGKEHIFNVEFNCIRDKSGKNSGYYVRLDDQTSEIEVMAREQYRSTHDELTGLYNRKYFFEEAERLLKTEPEVPRYLIATNIKNFKLINDLFGTAFGDNLLKYQAEMISKAKYTECIYGRISGDKFAMLIPKDRFRADLAVANTQKIMQFDTNSDFSISMYLGLYEIANPYENVHTMWDKASLAIQNNTDKNQILCIYNTSIMNKVVQDNNIISEFKFAINQEQFCMFIQPQVNAKTGKCMGGEALSRWYDHKGYRQPGEFIPILERAGLIYQLDHYIWEKAAKTLSEWKKRGIDYYISVNISVKDFYYSDIYSIFTGLVEKYEISPEKLHLEITESVVIGDKDFHRGIISRLQEYGFSIEMDDFGSGYSSLNILKEMKMDVLKIDMEFLHTTGNEERGKVIISTIVKMAKALGMKVISEGVETEAQSQFLGSIGVDLLQGYLYSKPIAVEEFEHKYVESAI